MNSSPKVSNRCTEFVHHKETKSTVSGMTTVSRWMRDSGRKPFPFQRQVWKAFLAGQNGILHSPTGSGKTLAIWLAAIADWHDRVGGLLADENKELAPKKNQNGSTETVLIRFKSSG